MKPLTIYLANPRGFCAGVERAINIVNQALKAFQEPIYVRHEVVHNKHVIEQLKQKGVVFVEDLKSIPDNSITIFSAHGVSKKIKAQAKEKNLNIFDATCPLVNKVHIQVTKASRNNTECILIGHKNHPEVEGTIGQYTADKDNIYLVESEADVENLKIKQPDTTILVTQTTLSVTETEGIIKLILKKYPSVRLPRKDDICYATQNRQNAVVDLTKKVDLVIVVGSKNSSNSNRLKELANQLGTPAYLIDNASMLQRQWFEQIQTCGITAGASAPEELVVQIIDKIKQFTNCTIQEMEGVKEDIKFDIPIKLRD